MLDIKYSMFFDRPAVMASVKDGTQSSLAKCGAFVRTRSARSIRPAPKKRIDPVPGKPPRGHVGTLRDLILFGYDHQTESMIVGPKLFKTKTSPPSPHLLEFGGSTNLKGKRATYRKFPFMLPALEAEQSKFPELFRGSVRG